MLEKWSEKYDSCRSCGTTERKHKGLGLCKPCHSRERFQKTYVKKANYFEWSHDYEKCVGCGTTKIPHKKQGCCNDCWIVSKPSLKQNEIHSTYIKGNRRCSFCFERFISSERVIDTIGIDNRADVFHEKCWHKSFDSKFDTTAPQDGTN